MTQSRNRGGGGGIGVEKGHLTMCSSQGLLLEGVLGSSVKILLINAVVQNNASNKLYLQGFNVNNDAQFESDPTSGLSKS